MAARGVNRAIEMHSLLYFVSVAVNVTYPIFCILIKTPVIDREAFADFVDLGSYSSAQLFVTIAVQHHVDPIGNLIHLRFFHAACGDGSRSQS